MSAFGYNESSAFEEFPLTKEEVLQQGFNWEDIQRGTYGKETINWKIFPDSILDLPKTFNVNEEIFVCIECNKNYRIILDIQDTQLIIYVIELGLRDRIYKNG